MRSRIRNVPYLLIPLAITGALLAGCAVQSEPVATATVGAPNTVTYPEGRYQLYGDGAATPYYWAWIPAGTSPPAPPPPPRPGVAHREGRYQLYGDGVATPYYWVWIPAGTAAVPPPPPPPRRF
ncbi:MAG: hypothetical protein HYV93_09705 [Candidatus Rokubacteria bacterium]|nr:hypothetical protein [Candidatus Rokubacteria bacterium]